MSMRGRYFPLGDTIPQEYLQELKDNGCMEPKKGSVVFSSRAHLGDWYLKHGLTIEAVWTGQRGSPKKGEWYLSGADVAAYRAPNDLSIPYHLARLVVVKTKVVREIVPTKPTAS